MAVAELDLDPDSADSPVLSFGPALGGPPPGAGDIFALVRLRGRPAATVLGHVRADEDPAEVLTAAFRARKGPHGPPAPEVPAPMEPALTEAIPEAPSEPGARRPATAPAAPPRTTVVVATRERAGQLARALDSLLAQDHPDFRVLVVDNAPVTTATRDLVESRYAGRVDYVQEPCPGLAVAHNSGVAAADGTVIAFTDDDVIADPRWLTALTTPFATDPGLGCVTGLILPARLTTSAQILLESHGGFAKGFEPRLYDPASPPADEPLFPFTAGSFGSGANMAFRAEALRAVAGFDPGTGTGTPARGGDDLYAFVRILAAGHRLRYAPEALVWHHHRETWQDLRNQAYGYGAGLTACLTALLVRRPALLPALLVKLPRGLAHARAITAHRPDRAGEQAPGTHGARAHPWPRDLSRLERRGMLYGPLGYLRARVRVRRQARGGALGAARIRRRAGGERS
ncbi:glycosyltransferase [Streptomyces lushanensis]|uniref:glycosyltransferase n=1 Tax=Streptomyces lushanensis TaxID=1434255 RepID=UPI00082B514C|nr:glycosyltransferase [Streptomyces lushanensis]